MYLGSARKDPKTSPKFKRQNQVHCTLHLKQYVQLGMKITKVHRILSFHQSAWLKPYIDFNAHHQKLATNDFEKDFLKLMNNSVFGKTMENLRNHRKVELVCKEERLRKVLAKPSVTSFKIFTENLLQ